MGEMANNDELELVRKLREHGVFLEVDVHKRRLERGMILVVCPDCDQREDMMGHAEWMFRQLKLPPRMHALALNGGAKLLAEGSPLSNAALKGAMLLEDIGGARHLKGIDTIALYAHYPCGAARLAGVNFETAVDLLMRAETRVKAQEPTAWVDAFVHVDHGDGRKRTYFVSHGAWLAWRANPTPNGAGMRVAVPPTP
jgi:hypothetical protein